MTERRDMLRVGEVAREAGVTVQTLHYYERRGLLAEPLRSGGGYRQYPRDTVNLVRAIGRAKNLGFTLKEIEELLSAPGAEPSTVRELAANKLAEVDARLEDLARVRTALAGLLETCVCGGDLGRCDILEGLGHDDKPND